MGAEKKKKEKNRNVAWDSTDKRARMISLLHLLYTFIRNKHKDFEVVKGSIKVNIMRGGVAE